MAHNVFGLCVVAISRNLKLTTALDGATTQSPEPLCAVFIQIMIPLVEEAKDLYQNLKVYENCYFGCGRTTKFWHCRTNQPICKECAKTHKVSEVEKCHPKYKPKTKKQYVGVS